MLSTKTFSEIAKAYASGKVPDLSAFKQKAFKSPNQPRTIHSLQLNGICIPENGHENWNCGSIII